MKLTEKMIEELTDDEIRVVLRDHRDQYRKAHSYIFEGADDQLLERSMNVMNKTYFGQVMKNTADSGVSREEFNNLMSAFSNRYCYILENENL